MYFGVIKIKVRQKGIRKSLLQQLKKHVEGLYTWTPNSFNV